MSVLTTRHETEAEQPARPASVRPAPARCRPALRWVRVVDGGARPRLEMRWDVVPASSPTRSAA